MKLQIAFFFSFSFWTFFFESRLIMDTKDFSKLLVENFVRFLSSLCDMLFSAFHAPFLIDWSASGIFFFLEWYFFNWIFFFIIIIY